MKIAAYLFLIFASLDVLLTAYAIEHWGAKEINPIANFVYEIAGVWGLWLGKLLLAVLIVIQRRADPVTAHFTLWLCAIVQVVVVAFTVSVHLLGQA